MLQNTVLAILQQNQIIRNLKTKHRSTFLHTNSFHYFDIYAKFHIFCDTPYVCKSKIIVNSNNSFQFESTPMNCSILTQFLFSNLNKSRSDRAKFSCVKIGRTRLQTIATRNYRCWYIGSEGMKVSSVNFHLRATRSVLMLRYT